MSSRNNSENHSILEYLIPASKPSNSILKNTVDFVEEHQFCVIQKMTLNNFFSQKGGW